MCSRFHAAPIVQATELLLQERTPRDVLVARPRAEEVSAARRCANSFRRRSAASPLRMTPLRARNLLSNGRYAVMLTAAGSGYSRWRDIADHALARRCHPRLLGRYIFLRDEQTGERVVGGLPAKPASSRTPMRRLFRGPCRNSSAAIVR